MYTLIQGAKLQKKWHKMGEKNKINILPDGFWNGIWNERHKTIITLKQTKEVLLQKYILI